jgi:predicted nucleotidyltransferase
MLSEAQISVLQVWANASPHAEWVTEIWLFGSRAKLSHRPDSDVDLAFALKDEPSRTAEGEAICMRQRWNIELTSLLGLKADVWWLNDPESTIVAPAVNDHGLRIWQRV